ncbi:TatD family hydrolase [Patescibacteria group bacterium]|nr:TatD family hydrolase [Patescibacteria group bacterium]
MRLVDSHCHLDFEPLSKELEAVLGRAKAVGVEKFINIGSSMRGSERSVDIAENYPNVWATVGLHPHDAELLMDFDRTMEKIRDLASQDKVVAIGEIGLDYFDAENQGTVSVDVKESQKKLLLAQLEIATQKKLPIVFHVRDAWDDFFEIANSKELKANSCVLHCFTGDEKIAKKAVDLGLYIGFTGFVTFDQPKFDHIREAAKIVPADRILVETDAPFLAPEPYRGKTNEPAYVLEVAKKISELKKLDVQDLAETTSKNAEKLFKI